MNPDTNSKRYQQGFRIGKQQAAEKKAAIKLDSLTYKEITLDRKHPYPNPESNFQFGLRDGWDSVS